MAKRTTKRDVILEGIDKEIASVKADIAATEAEIAVYRSDLSSLYAVGHALEKLRRQTAESLAPQPRQSAATAKTKPIPRCAVCGYAEASVSHRDEKLPDYHKYVPSQEPQKPKKKPSTKKPAGLPTSSSEDLMDRRPAPDEMCTYISDDGRGNDAECRSVQADPIHDKSMGYGGYHPFQPSSAAHSAQPKSSANGAESNGTANSETRVEDVGTAQSAAIGGD
jgi:hypothetical protein